MNKFEEELKGLIKSALDKGSYEMILISICLLRQIGEYIHEEARLSPSKRELEDFYTDTQRLRLAADRLDSLTKKIRKTIYTPRKIF